MDKVKEVSVRISTILTITAVTFVIFSAGFIGGWYKGQADTLRPMFFDQVTSSATEDGKRIANSIATPWGSFLHSQKVIEEVAEDTKEN